MLGAVMPLVTLPFEDHADLCIINTGLESAEDIVDEAQKLLEG